MSEQLTQVTERRRVGETYYIEGLDDGRYIFATLDESMLVRFKTVSAYIEWGSEWADFYNEDGTCTITICNEQSNEWPHWIFEELSHLEGRGNLRPVDDYETIYTPKHNRATGEPEDGSNN
jgi:hypothetical protein